MTRTSRCKMMISRRGFVAAAGAVVVAPPMVAAGQALAKPPVVGFLSFAAWEDHTYDRDGFRKGLKEHSHIEDRTVTIEERYAEGKVGRAADLIDDIISREVAVFVTL